MKFTIEAIEIPEFFFQDTATQMKNSHISSALAELLRMRPSLSPKIAHEDIWVYIFSFVVGTYAERIRVGVDRLIRPEEWPKLFSHIMAMLGHKGYETSVAIEDLRVFFELLVGRLNIATNTEDEVAAFPQ